MIVLTVFTVSHANEKIFKCTNSNGHIEFQKTQCKPMQGDAEILEIKTDGNTIQSVKIPTQTSPSVSRQKNKLSRGNYSDIYKEVDQAVNPLRKKLSGICAKKGWLKQDYPIPEPNYSNKWKYIEWISVDPEHYIIPVKLKSTIPVFVQHFTFTPTCEGGRSPTWYRTGLGEGRIYPAE